eukprot:g50214.t1
MDGTLLTSKKCIPRKTALCLSKLHAQGVHVIIATARSVNRVVPRYQDSLPPRCSILAFNGAVIAQWDATTSKAHILQEKTLPEDSVRQFLRVAS